MVVQRILTLFSNFIHHIHVIKMYIYIVKQETLFCTCVILIKTTEYFALKDKHSTHRVLTIWWIMHVV